jgi:hypothetical protein
MTLEVSALYYLYLLRVKQDYKNITGGVLYGLSSNQTIIQCLTYTPSVQKYKMF